MTGKYRTVDGNRARIICINLEDELYPVVAAVRYRSIQNGSFREDVRQYTANGKVMENQDSPLDLIEVSEWDDFKVDEPVLVRHLEGTWLRRNFAGVVNGKPTTWAHGTVEWTSAGQTSTWDECRRPEPEEI